MHLPDKSGIFEPYLPQAIASPFEEVFTIPAIKTLFVYKKYPLSEQQRWCQIPSKLPEVTFLQRRTHGPFWFTRPFFVPNKEQFRRIYAHFGIPTKDWEYVGSELACSEIWFSEYPSFRKEEMIPAAWLGKQSKNASAKPTEEGSTRQTRWLNHVSHWNPWIRKRKQGQYPWWEHWPQGEIPLSTPGSENFTDLAPRLWAWELANRTRREFRKDPGEGVEDYPDNPVQILN